MLSDDEKKLWEAVTRSVTPMNSSPTAFTEGLPRVPVKLQPRKEFGPEVDLHGHRIHDAFSEVRDYLEVAKDRGLKKVTVITGKSGQINQEMDRWVEGNPNVRSIKQNDNGGSWTVCLARKRNNSSK